MAPKSVAVVTTSVRGVRAGPDVSALVVSLLEPATPEGVTLSHVDLAAFNLPVFNESKTPAMLANGGATEFEQPQARAWSAEIARHDAYILVVPEYNYGVAGSTKNAIDYLYNEWKGKPAGVISYGIMGGNTAREQVRKSLGGVGLKVTGAEVGFTFPGGGYGEHTQHSMVKGGISNGTKAEWEGSGDEVKKMLAEIVEELQKPPAAEVVKEAAST
ncbi:NAD(P)H-dependent oxidoreductase [Microdochium nivale]|nr:NAD(P)H-dependent oxidoreductase [Microdochium nivale]